jgi:two-component system OmpR family sensor kinase
MTPRRALAVFIAAVVLLAAVNALVYRLYRREATTVEAALDDRLSALGATAAHSYATFGDPRLLASLVDENHLDDAYVVDAGMQVIAGAHTRPGTLELTRVDLPRFKLALEGQHPASNGRVAYFPINRARVLALEVGPGFRAPQSELRTTYITTVALSVFAVAVFAVGVLLALRSLERARLAYGRAERLAAVGQMAAMVAHEVRNPLGILRGQVELAREKLGAGAPERERERFEEMIAEIDRLNRLTEEFVGLARDVPLTTGPVDLGTLAREIAEQAQVAAKDARIEASGTGSVEADAAKLRQAIFNLVLNAVQVGARTVRIEVDGERITVADDGPGVPPELVATLFEPFVTARPGGSGLGLAVARRVAERHGGRLVLDPSERGARFSIYLRGAHGADPGR